MKFEHLLQLYWTKGYLFGGRIFPFRSTTTQLVGGLGGVDRRVLLLLMRRFEWNALLLDGGLLFDVLSGDERVVLNMFFARLTTVNNAVGGWQKLALVRLYLIKTYRGRCQAIGKPARGQRTWSNAWTAYRYNKTIRLFVAETRPSSVDVQHQHHTRLVQRTARRRRRRGGTPTPSIKKLFLKKRSGGLWN